MKISRATLVTLFLLLVLHTSLFGETWHWEEAQLNHPPQQPDTLVEGLTRVVQFPNDPRYHFLDKHDDGTATLVMDTSAVLYEHHWQLVPFPVEGLGNRSLASLQFNPDGNLMLGSLIDHGITNSYVGHVYHRDFSNEDAVWIEDESARITIEPGAGEINLRFAYADFDGDGSGDWAVFFQYDHDLVLRIYFSNPDIAGDWTENVQSIIAVGWDSQYSDLGINTAHVSSDPGCELLIKYCCTDFLSLPVSTYDVVRLVHIISRSELSVVNPHLPSLTYSTIDTDLDGTSELMVLDDSIWKLFDYDQNFFFSHRITPPHNIFAYMYQAGTSYDSLLYSIVDYRVYDDQGYWRSTQDLYEWNWVEEESRWLFSALRFEDKELYYLRFFSLNHESGSNPFVNVRSWHPTSITEGYPQSQMYRRSANNWSLMDSYTLRQNNNSDYELINMDGDTVFERIHVALDSNSPTGLSLSSESLTEQNVEWVETHSWPFPYQERHSMRAMDLNGDGLDDLLLDNNEALLARGAADASDRTWESVLPFSGLDPDSTYWPRVVLDIDGDGREDMVLQNGTTLLNRSTLEVREAPASDLPNQFKIASISPNPFNPTTTVAIALPQNGHLRVLLYNVLGQKVNTLYDAPATTGRASILLDGRSLSSGVYFIRASLDGTRVQTEKILLVK